MDEKGMKQMLLAKILEERFMPIFHEFILEDISLNISFTDKVTRILLETSSKQYDNIYVIILNRVSHNSYITIECMDIEKRKSLLTIILERSLKAFFEENSDVFKTLLYELNL